MSESVKVDGDSTAVSGNCEIEEPGVTSPSRSAALEKSNSLSLQLEEKIIRQVEVPKRSEFTTCFLTYDLIISVLLWGPKFSQG